MARYDIPYVDLTEDDRASLAYEAEIRALRFQQAFELRNKIAEQEFLPKDVSVEEAFDGMFGDPATEDNASLIATNKEGVVTLIEGLPVEPGAVFSQRYLPSVSFQEADLRAANFAAATLSRANFQGAQLSEATFERANCRDVDFTGACLEEVDFTNTDLRGADFTGAALGRAVFSGACLYNAILRNVNLEFVDLSGLRLSGADLVGAYFGVGRDLSNVELDGWVVDSEGFAQYK